MPINHKRQLASWFISYDIYTDVFQMYDDVVFKLDSNAILKRGYKDFEFTFLKDSNMPIMIEIKNSYDFFRKDANTMLKSDIIDKVSSAMEEYGKSAFAKS